MNNTLKERGRIRVGLISVLFALGVSTATAVPAKPGVRIAQQPDGTELRLRLAGDEFFHQLLTEEGLAVGRGEDGYFYFATPEGLTSVRAVNDMQRLSLTEASSLSELSGISSFVKARQSIISARRAMSRRGAVIAGAPSDSRQVPCLGTPKIPVLLVQYSDYKFKDSNPLEVFQNFFAKGDKSAYQYFFDQSNGKFTPQFDVYGPVTLNGKRSSYGGNDRDGNDVGVGKMVAEACQQLNSSINFSDYDNNGDGECDVVIVLYAGDGEASSYDDDAENAVWPCQWELSGSDYGRSLTLDATRVDKFAVFNELNAELTGIDGIGTFCHEFSHCLDLPDFYDTEYGPHFGMAHWSLLDYGCYNDDGYTPIGYTAYEKEFMGWIEIKEGNTNEYYTLPPMNLKNEATDKAVKLTNPKDKNEYFILENRKRQGWDKFMPAEGLLIYHVTYSKSAWENNVVNNYDMQRMTPVPADNDLKMDKEYYYGSIYYNINEDSLLGDLWPYQGNDEFSDSSIPAATLNSGGGKLGKPVTEIIKNSDGTISFWVDKAPLPSLDIPENIHHEVHSSNSATIYWDAISNHEEALYTLEIAPHREITYNLVSSTDFTTSFENAGWKNNGGYTNLEDQLGTRLGSNKQTGALISPSFSMSEDGIVTIFVTAAAYNNDKSSMVVSLKSSNGNLLDSETVTLTKSYDRYCILLNSDSADNVAIEIAAKEKGKRLYITNVEIFTGDASDALSSSVQTYASNADEKIVVSGISATSHTLTNLTSGIIYDYRVRALPRDNTKFTASAWSEYYPLDLSMVSDVMNVASDGGEPQYFTLDGVHLKGVPADSGVYIMILPDGKARKILVR